jgi:hypothetical protein
MSSLIYWSFAIALAPWALDLAWYLLSSADDLIRSRSLGELGGARRDPLDSAMLHASDRSRTLGWVGSLSETPNPSGWHDRIIHGVSRHPSSPHKRP